MAYASPVFTSFEHRSHGAGMPHPCGLRCDGAIVSFFKTSRIR